MRRLAQFGLALSLALSAAGGALAQEVSVDDLAARWTAAYNRASADGIAAIYSPNAELYVHGDQRLVGRSEIRAYWARDFQVMNPMTVLTVTDSVVDKEMILVHGNYQVLNRITGIPEGHGRFAHIWIRNGDLWFLDRDLWVEPIPAAK